MKKLPFILLLLPCLCAGQSFPELIALYEKECAEIVNDTVTQYGTVSYEIVSVLDNAGKIIHYALGKADTVWQKADCPDFKFPDRRGFTISSNGLYWSGSAGVTLTSSGPITGTTKQEKTTVEIERKYVCEVKLREVQPFSEDFWNWIKKQNKK